MKRTLHRRSAATATGSRLPAPGAPFYGIVKGHAYTLAWANFIVMIYFLHSLTNLWVASGMHLYLSILELLLASMMFIGCTYYARFRGMELGLKIPRLKDDPRR